MRPQTTDEGVHVVSAIWWKKEKAPASGKSTHRLRPFTRRAPADGAMEGASRKSVDEGRDQCGADTVEQVIRERVREIMLTVLEQELEAALGARASQRTASRSGYRHGVRERVLVTSLGPTRIEVPRARLHDERGAMQE